MTIDPHSKIFDAQGRELSLGLELGRGGEATVFKLREEPGKAVKLYHQADETRVAKLEAMMANPPDDPTGTGAHITGAHITGAHITGGHISLAWPQALVFSSAGQAVGFVMPRIDAQSSLPLHQLYNPKTRRGRAPGLTWRYLVRIARNLCAVVAALHKAGYVIGDLNESNILVTDRALVSLVDCDSVQVRDSSKLYRCLVGKGEYTAPELQGKPFAAVTRQPKHDTFALAVLLFMLLMEGVHPFSAVYRGEGEPPSTLESIQRRRSAFLGASMLEPAPGAPLYSTLPYEVRRLFRQAFRARFNRPSARRWQAALENLEQTLSTCDLNAYHRFSAHLSNCPWCARTANLGLESFPNTTPDTPTLNTTTLNTTTLNTTTLNTTTPNTTTGPGKARVATQVFKARLPLYFSGSLWAWLKTFFVIASLLITLSGISIYTLSLLSSAAAPSFTSEPRPLLLVGTFLFLSLVFILVGFYKTRASPIIYRRLRGLEKLARAIVSSVAIALALSFLIGTATGSGNVFEGDWLLLPSFWFLSFWLVWRRLRFN